LDWLKSSEIIIISKKIIKKNLRQMKASSKKETWLATLMVGMMIIAHSTSFAQTPNPIPIPSLTNLSSIAEGLWYVDFLYSENLWLFGGSLLDCLTLNISFYSFENVLAGGSVVFSFSAVNSSSSSAFFSPFQIVNSSALNTVWIDSEFIFYIVDIDPVNFSWMVLVLKDQRNILNQAFMMSRDPNKMNNLLILSQKVLLTNEGFPINSTNSYYLQGNNHSECGANSTDDSLNSITNPPDNLPFQGSPQHLKRFTAPEPGNLNMYFSELVMMLTNQSATTGCITYAGATYWNCSLNVTDACNTPTFLTIKNNSENSFGIFKPASNQSICGQAVTDPYQIGPPYDLAGIWMPANGSGQNVTYSFPELLISFNWSNPTKNLNNYSIFEAVLVENLATNQTFHVLTALFSDNTWIEAARSIEPYPNSLLVEGPQPYKVLAKIIQSTSFSIYSTNVEKMIMLGTYRNYPGDNNSTNNSFQPIIQLHNVPNSVVNQQSSYVTAIRNIKCLNCTFVDAVVSEIGTRTFLTIILSSGLKNQQRNQLWKINSLQDLDKGAVKLNFSFYDRIKFAVQGINYDETEGLFVASATQLYWFNQSDESIANRWHNLSLQLNPTQTITLLEANSVILNSASSSLYKNLLTGIPCLLIGLSDGSLLLFSWTGALTYDISVLMQGSGAVSTLIVHSVPPWQHTDNPTLWPTSLYFGTYQISNNAGLVYYYSNQEGLIFVTPRVYENIIVEKKNVRNMLNSSSLSEIRGYSQKMDMWSWAAVYQSISQYYYFQLPNGNPNKTLQQCAIVNNFYKELSLERGFDCCSIDDGSPEFTFCDMLGATADDMISLLKTNLNLTSRYINADSLTSLMIINQIQNNRPVILGLSSNQLHYAMVTGYIRSTPQESNTETLLFKIWDPAIGNYQYSTLSEYNGLPEFIRKDPLIPNLNQAIVHPNNPTTIDFANSIPSKYSIEYALFVTVTP
jgi:hypothetical protein